MYESSYIENSHFYGQFGFSFEEKTNREEEPDNAFDLIKKQNGWFLYKNLEKIYTFKNLTEALDYLYPIISVWLENFQEED